MAVRRAGLASDEIVEIDGLPVTSGIRTALDLAGGADHIQAVIALDMALHARLTCLDTLVRFEETNRGRKGVARLRRALRVADPATESPMETRLRLLIRRARLPRPLAQVTIHDSDGCFIARPDFLCADQRLALEFDGGVHREQLVNDDRCQNRLANAGYRVLRFTAADVMGTPAAVVDQIRVALRARSPKPRR